MALIGPRQVGKTTLALEVSEHIPALYLDLEAREDRAKLSDPALFLKDHADKLVILDEIHWVPELLQTLRGLIDTGCRFVVYAGSDRYALGEEIEAVSLHALTEELIQMKTR